MARISSAMRDNRLKFEADHAASLGRGLIIAMETPLEEIYDHMWRHDRLEHLILSIRLCTRSLRGTAVEGPIVRDSLYQPCMVV